MSENLPSKKAVLFYDRRTDLPSFVQMVLAIFGVARDSAYKPLLPPARLFFSSLQQAHFVMIYRPADGFRWSFGRLNTSCLQFKLNEVSRSQRIPLHSAAPPTVERGLFARPHRYVERELCD